jgi:peptidoglycan-associated lipoprotein
MDVDAINRLDLVRDVHFDFDKSDLRDADRAVLARDADVLKKYDFLKANIEGYCDDRGTVEYNLALGERRADAMRDYLVSLGVPTERLRTVSYGKEKPVCTEDDEACWARNRRAHPSVTGKTTSP